MGFGRFRTMFRREPTRQELYLQLLRGLNIERDYQAWIDTWENYQPALAAPGPGLPITVILAGAPTDSDTGYWNSVAESQDAIMVERIESPVGRELRAAIARGLPAAPNHVVILHPSD